MLPDKRVPEPPQPRPSDVDSALVLVDITLQPIASDPGASVILSPNGLGTSGSTTHPLSIPEDILDAIRNRSNQQSGSVACSIGLNRYRCRFYFMQTDHPALSPAVVALHFDADWTADAATHNPIAEIVKAYHLTEREEEALRGIALGLCTKELAERMKISPNTVKSFVRLIMIKLGVTSRAAIMVKLLESSERKESQ